MAGIRHRLAVAAGVSGVRHLRRWTAPAPCTDQWPEPRHRAAAGGFDQAVPRVSREVVFTTHTPVPAGHDRFNQDLMEEHLGPLREGLAIPPNRLMELGRENPGNTNEDFCMTVLGLRLSRRANAVSALHGEVSRAMWTGLYPGKPEDEVPIGHITNGVHVPSWLAPQMFRLYDRHFGAGWQEHGADPGIWEGIESVDDAELWETHLHLKSRLLDFVRHRVVEQAERRDESPEMLQRLGPGPQPRRADDRFRSPLRHLQARRPDPGGHRKADVDGQRCQPPGAVYLRRQGAPARRTRQENAAADCQADARLRSSPTNSSSSKTTTSTSAAIWCRALTCG